MPNGDAEYRRELTAVHERINDLGRDMRDSHARLTEQFHEAIGELTEAISEVSAKLGKHIVFCEGQCEKVERHSKLLNGDGKDAVGLRREMDAVKDYQRRHRWVLMTLGAATMTGASGFVFWVIRTYLEGR